MCWNLNPSRKRKEDLHPWDGLEEPIPCVVHLPTCTAKHQKNHQKNVGKYIVHGSSGYVYFWLNNVHSDVGTSTCKNKSLIKWFCLEVFQLINIHHKKGSRKVLLHEPLAKLLNFKAAGLVCMIYIYIHVMACVEHIYIYMSIDRLIHHPKSLNSYFEGPCCLSEIALLYFRIDILCFLCYFPGWFKNPKA